MLLHLAFFSSHDLYTAVRPQCLLPVLAEEQNRGSLVDTKKKSYAESCLTSFWVRPPRSSGKAVCCVQWQAIG